ncbi:MAG: alpha-mannosidase [Chloroflexi bacterium]|nr:alpha-mannosidase [Chloroflexota bacterium]
MHPIRVHMIAQAHLDPVWLWRWTEGQAEALATSQSAIDRLHEYPSLHFTRGESQIYQWIQEEDPVLWDEIGRAIRAGRWHVVNGMIIQPDMNLPHGESFVRHFLLGKRYMQEHLDADPKIGYCVDSFGHIGTLPQILKGCGIDYYVFMRPGPHEKDLPSQAFWWQAPDGSRVLAFRITASYGSRSTDHEEHIDQAIQATPSQLSDTMCFFGVGNHGGGPTREQIDNVQAIAKARTDADIRFSSPQAYFEAVSSAPAIDTLPTVAEELQFHAVGCYSANSPLKQNHRRAECRLLIAERMVVLAAIWSSRSVCSQSLHKLWHTLCFNQFHDILGGCAIKEAEDDAIRALGAVISGAQEITNRCGRAIAAEIDTRGIGGAMVLFNPSLSSTEQYIEYEPWTEWQPWESGGWSLSDECGRQVPCQVVETREALSSPQHGVNRVLFKASIPPLGYRTYRFGRDQTPIRPEGSARASQAGLENDRLIVRLDPSSGAIVSCQDRSTHIEYVGSKGWNVAQVLQDTSDTWSHGVQRFDQVVAHFGDAHITISDDGPLQASLLVERTYESNHWLQQLVLRHGQAELLIRNWLYWQGHWQMIKLAFDVPTESPQAAHDVPFGWCHRPCDGKEVPTHMWMDVAGPVSGSDDRTLGLALVNDGKYGCDVKDSTMRLTILRCPPYAYHEPHVPESKHRYDWIDQGLQEFNLVLLPHTGDWRDARITERAREVNMPLVSTTVHGHAGRLPAVNSLASLSTDELELTALKPADDGDGYILRVADRHGRGGSGYLTWTHESFPVAVAPFQVATFRIRSEAGQWTLSPCNMIEAPR